VTFFPRWGWMSRVGGLAAVGFATGRDRIAAAGRQ